MQAVLADMLSPVGHELDPELDILRGHTVHPARLEATRIKRSARLIIRNRPPRMRASERKPAEIGGEVNRALVEARQSPLRDAGHQSSR
jgi:hypothetical protein